MKLRDRLSGAVTEQLPTPTHFGRWTFELVDDDRPTYLNGCPVAAGDVLVPGTTGRWALVRPGDAVATRGELFGEESLGEQDVAAVLQLGQRLMSAETSAGGWLQWCDISPLAPGLDKTVEPHPLERHIAEELVHLTEVCRNPSTHIRVETERVLASRARRISPHASTWLAAHTEDWDHRRLSGIQPRRILAEIREEQLDLYENRVAARLVDNLVTWLRRRIFEVRRVLEDIFVRLEHFDVSTTGNRRRTERICKLWGEAWKATHGREAAMRTLERLEGLLYGVLALMDSPLHRRVPRRAQVPLELRMTNLLSNHDAYRGVARLWHHWARLAVPRAPSPGELYARHQELCRSFDAWCMLVVVRACALRWQPADDAGLESPISPGCVVALENGFRLTWERGGTIVLADGEAVRLRIVPLAHVIERSMTSRRGAATISSLMEAATSSTEAPWTVVLHPALPGRAEHAALAGLK